MIKILTQKLDIFNNFIDDTKNDLIIDIKKIDKKNIIFEKYNNITIKVLHILYHLLDRFYPFQIPVFKAKPPNSFFCLILGPDFGKFLLARLRNEEIIPYMMDAWPNYHDRIERAIRLLGIKTMFFSSKQVAEKFKEKGVLNRAIWLPEAISIEKYRILPYESRDIDVLNFGRKWDWHHNGIKEYLKANNINYLFQEEPSKLLLPNREVFLDTLSKAKITICVPSNITHPARSGEIETVTWRYFQCMASKTLILGIAPKELIELFEYNPIIEIDKNAPEKQIKTILANYDDYITLIEKNYIEVKKNHTWVNRWRLIEKQIL